MVTVRFHPSLPEHGRRLVESLGFDVVLDESAPTGCPCGCVVAERGVRLTASVERVDARAIAERSRARLRAEVCPVHGEKWCHVRGVRICRACEREDALSTSEAV